MKTQVVKLLMKKAKTSLKPRHFLKPRIWKIICNQNEPCRQMDQEQFPVENILEAEKNQRKEDVGSLSVACLGLPTSGILDYQHF